MSLNSKNTTQESKENSSEEDQKMYGWYSKKAAETINSYIYMDNNGKEVLVTDISYNKINDDYKWNDVKYVGIMTKYIKTNYNSNSNFIRK